MKKEKNDTALLMLIIFVISMIVFTIAGLISYVEGMNIVKTLE